MSGKYYTVFTLSLSIHQMKYRLNYITVLLTNEKDILCAFKKKKKFPA